MFVIADGAKRLSLVACVLLLASCATTPSSTAEAPPGESRARASRSSRVLTAEELASVPELNALQAVERLRPTWLRARGLVSLENQQFQGVRIYVDGNPRGYRADMAELLVWDIEEMRFMDSREATTRFGTGYPDGVIVITTKRR